MIYLGTSCYILAKQWWKQMREMREIAPAWEGHGTRGSFPLGMVRPLAKPPKPSRDASWEWGDSRMASGRKIHWVLFAGPRLGSERAGVVCFASLPLLRRRGLLDIYEAKGDIWEGIWQTTLCCGFFCLSCRAPPYPRSHLPGVAHTQCMVEVKI